MSSRIDFKTLWPRNGHADSLGVKAKILKPLDNFLKIFLTTKSTNFTSVTCIDLISFFWFTREKGFEARFIFRFFFFLVSSSVPSVLKKIWKFDVINAFLLGCAINFLTLVYKIIIGICRYVNLFL